MNHQRWHLAVPSQVGKDITARHTHDELTSAKMTAKSLEANLYVGVFMRKCVSYMHISWLMYTFNRCVLVFIHVPKLMCLCMWRKYAWMYVRAYAHVNSVHPHHHFFSPMFIHALTLSPRTSASKQIFLHACVYVRRCLFLTTRLTGLKESLHAYMCVFMPA
jgi:hypothetical protein